MNNLDLIQARVSEVPEGWVLSKVAGALNIRNNFRKPISQEVRSHIQGDYPYYGPTKIQDYISEYEQDGTYALIGEDGDHFLKFSTMSQTQFISGKCTVNNHAHIIESSDTCDSKWFYNYFKHRDITNFLSRQGAGRFKLNKATLERLPILVPPLPEQRKIAKILSTWDKAIATTEKLIATSKQQKKALMQQLLTGKKRLVNPETGRVFEGKWEEVELGEVSSIYDGTHSTPKYVEQGVPFYSVEHLTRGDFSKTKFISEEVFAKENKRVKLECGDILMTRIGDIGTAKCLDWDVRASFYVSLALIKANREKFDSQYMGYYINSHEFHRELYKRTIHVAFPKKINLGEINKCRVLFPSTQEQQKIAQVLTAADKEVEQLQFKLGYFKQEKKALMQQLLTGKRRVKVDTEAGAVL
ncbi:restriction endonuclease subunit S [Leucothrix arctica]|uniref:Restriction endonuclease subunit S n=1 Tax=Leucothrix arctica TaxID=1481894 RepID=A0A317C874_9GAMM|nr:restriction endonuclease subunit S [Leucothrix arctica]PWQ94497.1 restriction endonuclease subunit S [Leucothrix arctica]